MKEHKSKLDPYAKHLDEWFSPPLKLTLEQAAARLASEYDLSVSRARLSEWWEARCNQKLQTSLLSQIATGSRTCQAVEKEFGRNPAPELEVLIKLHRVLFMNLAAHGQTDPQAVANLSALMKSAMEWAKLQEKQKDRKLDERRLELLEKKAAQADETSQVTTSNYTPEEKMARIKQIFGLK